MTLADLKVGDSVLISYRGFAKSYGREPNDYLVRWLAKHYEDTQETVGE